MESNKFDDKDGKSQKMGRSRQKEEERERVFVCVHEREQGILTEGKESVQLTSLYLLVQISYFSY